MFKRNQKGFTLIELMIVISVATLMGLIALESQRRAIIHMQAKVHGNEVAQVAMSLSSFVGYYSGIPAGASGHPESPAHRASQVGINFLKSRSCRINPVTGAAITSETTSSGPQEIGFLPDCTFLSHLTSLSRDQRTTFQDRAIQSTFYRNNLADLVTQIPNNLSVISYIEPLQSSAGVNMVEASGLSAAVANGLQLQTSGQRTGPGYQVFSCFDTAIAAASTNPRFRMACSNPSSEGMIAIVVNADSANNIWLRTDGTNTMNAPITFNNGMPGLNQSLINFTKMVLAPISGGDPDKGKLQIANSVGDLLVEVSDTDFDVLKGNLTVHDGDLNVANGRIDASDVIASSTAVAAPMFYTEREGLDGYVVDINGRSNMNQVVARQLEVLSGNGSQVALKVNANGTTRAGGANIDTERLDFDSSSTTDVRLTGNVDMRELRVRMGDNSVLAFKNTLSRYRLLDVRRMAHNQRFNRNVYAATCSVGNLRYVVTPHLEKNYAGLNIGMSEWPTQYYAKPPGYNGLWVDRNFNHYTRSEALYRFTRSGDYILMVAMTRGINYGSHGGHGMMLIYCLQNPY
ncbi:type II secretion system protein [Vibrio splendidus]